MKKHSFYCLIILIGILNLNLFVRCQKDTEESKNSKFNFPEITNIDSSVYNEIKKTCEKYWDLDKMIDTTFKIIAEGDEYVVQCEGYLDGKLYLFIIRVDKNGKWINDGRSPKT
jgi:hypothetical protein